MPRELSTEVETASTSPRLSPIALVELEFDSGAFRMWTGWGTLLWGDLPPFTDGTYFDDGTTWTDLEGLKPWYGAGDLGTIGPIEETTEVRAIGVELGLSGITTEILQIALGETWQNRPGRIYIGVLDSQGQLDGEPYLALEGLMDHMTLVDGIEAGIKMMVERENIDNERSSGLRYTPESQRARFADDAFCDFVASLQEVDVRWGTA